MKIIVLGCGNIGSVITKDLAESLPAAEITMADMDENRVAEAASKIGRKNVSTMQVDASNPKELVSVLGKSDLAVDALPGWLGYRVCKTAISAKVDMVDVSYMPEDVMKLSNDALKAKICLIPDCGMSPGIGNILVGHAASRLDKVESIHILNGGLPEKPFPPLGYIITWSSSDLIDMYLRKVNIVENGKKTQVEPMTELEEIRFPRVGKLEAFYTDGLRTLLHTMKNVEEMWEKTFRYPGHVEKIRLLKALGWFDEKPVKVGNLEIVPRDVAAKLLEKKLKRPEIPDIVAMLIEVVGLKGGKRVKYTYQMFDRSDEKHNVTAMARTTAYTASVIAQLAAKKAIVEKGVMPPEKLGMNDKIYRRFLGMMKKRGIKIKETRKILP
jgi:saccharopine dehydrogenase-like NADP-dependent oxidoreductase